MPILGGGMGSVVTLSPTMWGVFFTIECSVVTGWTPTIPWRKNNQVSTRVKKMKLTRMMKTMTVVVKVDFWMRWQAWTMKSGLWWTRMERVFPYTAVS